MYAIKIALCDDQEQYIDMLMKHVERYGNEVDTEFNITVYNSGRKLIDDIKTDSKMYDIVFLDVEMPEINGLKIANEVDTEFNITVYNSGRKLIDDIKTDSKMYDIVFLDVEMPEINGLKIAEAIRQMSEDIVLCFVTGHEQYAREAYQVEALGYIVKPVAYNELKKLLRRAVIMVKYEHDNRKSGKNYIEVPVSGDKRIVDVRTIKYIEKNRNQCILHFSDSELKCYESLKKMYNRLDNELFVYVHQGYIVNFNEIKEVKENVICFGRNVEVPVSRRRYKEVRDRHLSRIKQLLEEKSL